VGGLGQPVKVLKNMKLFKIIYYIFIASIAAIAVLLVVSVFPITGNYKLLVVQSGSMEPAIKMGSVVIVKPIDDYQINDVITFVNPKKRQELISHRIVDLEVSEGGTFYITKGDANEDPDARKVVKDEVIGKILFSVPYLGYAVDFAKKPLGFASIIIIPAAVIIFDEIKKIFKEVKKKKEQRKT